MLHILASLIVAATYAEQRASFHTAVSDTPASRTPPPSPPRGVFELVRYDAPLGKNAAYVTPVRKDGRKRPAILWLAGGFDWSIDDSAWNPAPRDNDQSARAFREAGLVLMLPSYRGCNDNPGAREYFLGEVDDVLAALQFLRKRPDVDPEHVYLGGHSTGGTLALLAAASGAPVRAVYAFGAVPWVKWYGDTGTALDRASEGERRLRSPGPWVAEIKVPVYAIEGSDRSNADGLPVLAAAARGAPLHTILVPGATHFSVLAPASEVIARKLMAGEDRLDQAELRR